MDKATDLVMPMWNMSAGWRPKRVRYYYKNDSQIRIAYYSFQVEFAAGQRLSVDCMGLYPQLRFFSSAERQYWIFQTFCFSASRAVTFSCSNLSKSCSWPFESLILTGTATMFKLCMKRRKTVHSSTKDCNYVHCWRVRVYIWQQHRWWRDAESLGVNFIARLMHAMREKCTLLQV